jgi:hypothetical protein
MQIARVSGWIPFFEPLDPLASGCGAQASNTVSSTVLDCVKQLLQIYSAQVHPRRTLFASSQHVFNSYTGVLLLVEKPWSMVMSVFNAYTMTHSRIWGNSTMHKMLMAHKRYTTVSE